MFRYKKLRRKISFVYNILSISVGEDLPTKITQRPALKIMKAARGLNLSPTKNRDALLYSSARAQSTTSVHSQVVEVFMAYLRKRNLPATTFRERVLQDFVHYLEDIRKPYSFLKQVSFKHRKLRKSK